MWRVPVIGLLLAAFACAPAQSHETQDTDVPTKQVQTEEVGLAFRRLDDAYEITFAMVPRRVVLGRVLAEAGVSVEWRDEGVADQIISGKQTGSLDEIMAALLDGQSFIARYVAVDAVPRMSHLTMLGPAAAGSSPGMPTDGVAVPPETGEADEGQPVEQPEQGCAATADARRPAPEPFISASISSSSAGRTLRARGQVMLDVGRILIAGGWDDCRGTASNVSEIVDVATGRSTPTGTMLTPRADFAMQVLPSGDVLAIGGTTANALTGSTDRIERFEVASGRWKDAGTLAMRKTGAATCALRDGTMLVVGGTSGGGADFSRRAERFDPRSGKGRMLAAPTANAHETAPKTLLLGDGRCLITSVGRGANLELFDPATDAFAPVAVPPDVAGTLDRVTQLGLLPDGSVLIVAARSFVFSPGNGRFRSIP